MWILATLFTIHSQTKVSWNSDGSLSVTGGQQTFSSFVPANIKDINNFMVHLNFSTPFMNFGDRYPGGILTSDMSAGEVTLKVYGYDASKPGGKGVLVYGCKSNQNGFNELTWDENCSTSVFPGQSITKTNVKSKDMKELIKAHKLYLPENENCTGFVPGVSNKTTALAVVGAGILVGIGGALAVFTGGLSLVTALSIAGGITATGGLTGTLIYQTPNECKAYGTPIQPVVVELTVKDATVKGFKFPGDSTLHLPFETIRMSSVINDFVHPDMNKIMLVSHRGYFKDVAENTLKAIDLAIKMGLPMVELDIALTKDSQWVLSHDKELGRTARTIVPSRLKNTHPKLNTKHVPISEFTLEELRPDLAKNSTCKCNPMTGTYDKSDTCVPVLMNNLEEGSEIQPIATLDEALKLCKGRIMVNLDKIENSTGNTRALAPYHLIWRSVVKNGAVGEVIVKGKKWLTSQQLRDSFPNDPNSKYYVDWNRLMYTPTFFPNMPESQVSSAAIDSWLNDSQFNCPGFELIYMQEGDNLYKQIPYIKSKNKHVIQFPMWPESALQVIADGTCRTDKRNNWSWLLNNPNHRPTLIISDRLEVLNDLLIRNGFIGK